MQVEQIGKRVQKSMTGWTSPEGTQWRQITFMYRLGEPEAVRAMAMVNEVNTAIGKLISVDPASTIEPDYLLKHTPICREYFAEVIRTQFFDADILKDVQAHQIVVKSAQLSISELTMEFIFFIYRRVEGRFHSHKFRVMFLPQEKT